MLDKFLEFWHWTLRQNCRDGNCKQCHQCFSVYVEKKMSGRLDV